METIQITLRERPESETSITCSECAADEIKHVCHRLSGAFWRTLPPPRNTHTPAIPTWAGTFPSTYSQVFGDGRATPSTCALAPRHLHNSLRM